MAEDRDEAGVYRGPGEKSIPLITPVDRVDGTKLTSVTLREPDAKQLSTYLAKVNDTNDSGVEAMTLLISLCSGVLPPDAEKLKQRDHDACADFLSLFTRAQPKNS